MRRGRKAAGQEMILTAGLSKKGSGMSVEGFANFLESIAAQMPRIVAAFVQILFAVEEIVWRVALFVGFLYGVYRFALDRHKARRVQNQRKRR